jgi:hypothetical protein
LEGDFRHDEVFRPHIVVPGTGRAAENRQAADPLGGMVPDREIPAASPCPASVGDSGSVDPLKY